MRKIDNLSFAEAVERLADRVGHPAALHRRLGSAGRARRTDAADGGQPAGRGVLRRAADHAGRADCAAVPGRARLRPGGGGAFRRRLRPARRTCAAAPPAGSRFRRQGSGCRRTDPRSRLRLLPEPAALADPRLRPPGDRLRRPADLRRRPDAGEVPEHAGDRALQEVARPLRTGPGPHLDQQEEPGCGGRGLHRRDGRSPVRGRHRGGLLRHRLRGRPRQAAAPADGQPRRVPRRGDLHLRRRRRRSGRRAQGLLRRPELHHPDVRGDRADRARPLRPAAAARRGGSPRAGGPADAALPVRDDQPAQATRPRPRRRPAGRTAGGCAAGRQHPRHRAGHRLRPRAGRSAGDGRRRGARRGDAGRLPVQPAGRRRGRQRSSSHPGATSCRCRSRTTGCWPPSDRPPSC